MIHLGHEGAERARGDHARWHRIRAGRRYLVALNQAIAVWGKGIYIRPMAEMNNAANPTPATWQTGAAGRGPFAGDLPQGVRAHLRDPARRHRERRQREAEATRAPAAQGRRLPVNPFPRLRIVWSPLASDNPRVAGNAAAQYYPGAAFVDVEGGRHLRRAPHDTAPWQGLESCTAFARSAQASRSRCRSGGSSTSTTRRSSSTCAPSSRRTPPRLRSSTRATRLALRPRSTSRSSRSVYRRCVTPLAGPLPAWARAAPARRRRSR